MPTLTTDLDYGPQSPWDTRRRMYYPEEAAVTPSVTPSRVQYKGYPGQYRRAPVAPVATAAGTTAAAALGGGGSREQASLARAIGEEARLGEPTSFLGGAGAPEAPQVIRGMTPTYSIPGGGGQEFATPTGAQQAWNRQERQAFVGRGGLMPGEVGPPLPPERREAAATARYGQWQPPGETAFERQAIATGLPQERQERAALFEQQVKEKRDADITKSYQSEVNHTYQIFDKKENKYKFPDDPHLTRDMETGKRIALETGDVQAGVQFVAKSRVVRNAMPDEYLTVMASDPTKWRKMVEDYYPSVMRMQGPPLPAPKTGGWWPPWGAAASTTSTQPLSAGPQVPYAGAAETGEAAGAPMAAPLNLGPGWGKPLGGAPYAQPSLSSSLNTLTPEEIRRQRGY